MPNTKTPAEVLVWETGYALIDGILSKIISKHGMIMKTVVVGQKTSSFILTDNEGRYSHGDTIKEAKESLLYKIKGRDTTKYKNLSLDTVFTFTEAVQCYRVITGACEAGTRHFVLQVGKKQSYTIKDMLEITKGQYGYDTFSAFFNIDRNSK
jgi:hypothetical protein